MAPRPQFRHTPPTRVTGGRDPAREKVLRACTAGEGVNPAPKKNMKTISESKRSLLCGRVAQTGTIIYGAPQRTLHPAQERFVRFLVYGERAVLIGKSKRENVL